MKTISVSGTDPVTFVQKVTASLSTRELGKIVSLSATLKEIKVNFSKLGSSEIVFSCVATPENGFRADVKSEKIAFAHKIFRSDVEGKLERIMTKLGAVVS